MDLLKRRAIMNCIKRILNRIPAASFADVLEMHRGAEKRRDRGIAGPFSFYREDALTLTICSLAISLYVTRSNLSSIVADFQPCT